MIDDSAEASTLRRHSWRGWPEAALWTALLLGAPVAAGAAALPATRTLELWPEGAPGARGHSEEDRPAVTAYLPAPETNTGAGIVILPGGGFTRRCADHEGVLAAEWLRGRGVAAFILRYRVVPIGTLKDALQDAHRGMRYVRAHAREWGVSPQRLGAMGFSAGATLAASVALRSRPGQPVGDDPVERVTSRPDFLVLAYGDANQASPGVRGLAAHGLTPEEAAQIFSPMEAELASAPPAFLFCTTEDGGQARGMADLYARLVQASRPVEAHFFGFGEHGVGFALGDPLLGEWPSLLLSWMRTSGWLTEQPRVALRGSIKVDGEPLPRGSVVLTPVEGTAAPAVIGYVFGTVALPGEFVVRAERGPTPGRYRVEVRQDATRWASNARDPVLQKTQQKLRDGGALTKPAVDEWVAWARSRDYSSSIENQRVYRRRRPGDAEEMTVDIQAGSENRLDLEIHSR
jgi:acetyl esterase/lipase